MWEFRPIGKHYELLVDGDSIYLCSRQDTLIQAVLENLCNRHNAEIAKYDELDVEITSYDEAYLNGLEDGKEEGYAAGYKRGLADALGKDEIK